jgi:hypothetical protein
MTQYEYLSEIYTANFMFYAGCAQYPGVVIDLESSTIMGSLTYDQQDVITIIENYWDKRKIYESQFSTTDFVMPDYVQDTITHSEKQVNAINNELLPPEKRIYG